MINACNTQGVLPLSHLPMFRDTHHDLLSSRISFKESTVDPELSWKEETFEFDSRLDLELLNNHNPFVHFYSPFDCNWVVDDIIK